MEKKRIEVAGINAYELQEKFDGVKSKRLQELRDTIEEEYQGDGEYQAGETTDEILEGEDNPEVSR